MIAQMGRENLSAAHSCGKRLAAQNFYQLFQFEPHLMNELLALIEIDLRVVAGEPVSGSANGKTLFIEQAADLPNNEHVLALVITAVAAPFDRFELREFLFPIAQNVRFDAAQLAHFADGEVPLSGNRRQFAIVAWFQHTP